MILSQGDTTRSRRYAAVALGCALVAALIATSPQKARGQSLQAIEDEIVAISESSMAFCARVSIVRRIDTTLLTKLRGGPKDDLVLEQEVTLSGMLLDDTGHVVTLGEALNGATRVSVGIFDGGEEHLYSARVVGFEPQSNIGLIKLDSESRFKAPLLADSDMVKPGAFVIGLGYPYNLGPSPSVSWGNVSAIGRDFASGRVRYKNLIETSFVINPGETGGPLINSSGEITGLLLTSYSGNRKGQIGFRSSQGGISLVVPMNTVRREVEKILDKQAEDRHVEESDSAPWLGFVAEEIEDAALRNQLKLHQGGVLIWHVYKGQAAANAGVKRHDILTRVNNQHVQGLDHLKILLDGVDRGEKIDLVLIRNGKTITTNIKTGEK